MVGKHSIRTKLIISYVAVALLSLVVLGVLFSRLLSDYLFTQHEELLIARGHAVARILKDVAWGRPLNHQARNVLENMGDFTEAQVWFVDRTGLIIATSKGSAEWEGIQLANEEFIEVMKGTVVTRRGRIGRFNTAMITVAVPVTVGNQVLGALFMNTPVSAVEETISHVRRLVLGASAFAFLVSSLVGVVLSRGITRPLRAMTKLAQEMTQGVFHRRAPIETRDEIGELGQAINMLAQGLEQSLGDLQEERDKFQSIVASIGEGVIAADNDSNLLWINPQAVELLRVGHIPADKLKMEDLSVPLLDLLHRVGETGRVEALDVSPHPSIVLRAYGNPIRRGNERAGSVILLQDVSEARRLENMRRDFVANITHELRTPLTSIRGFVEPLLDGTVDDDQTRARYLGIVRDEALRLNRLIDDLLDLAKLESGSMAIGFEVISLGDVAERVKAVFGPLAEQKGIKLSTTYPNGDGEGLCVMGDADRLQQVITNFVDNALRHTEQDGEVAISVSSTEHRVIAKVADSGRGIEPDLLPYVWDRFYKVDKSRKKSQEGTGLGLSIARGIVENHGGEVFATSRPGEGAIFGFALPKAPL
ncbi:MAG: cell wall metabolism sensor histidine kinase WalK [Firmicutes bacterium]|nr:cell wall metabolism sensor histidine kinase WalK [Bacillota bacterium]